MTDEKKKKLENMAPTYIGSAIGFLTFLVVGAVPGLLYGGYMGLIMAGALFGTPVEPSILARIMTGGGMVLGLLATLALFLVLGAIGGTLVGWVVRPVVRAFAHRHPREAEAENHNRA